MDFIYVFKKHWKLAANERLKVCIYFVLHIVSVIAITAQPLAFAMIINTLQNNNKSNNNTLVIVSHWLIAYVACFYIFEVCHRLARGIELSVAYHNKKKFVLNSYMLLQAMTLDWHAKHHSGNVISRVNKASDSLLAFGQSIYNYITAIIQFAMAAVVLWLISPVISAISIFAGGILVIVTRLLYNKTVPEYRSLNKGFNTIASTLQDGISNITTIIILRLGKCVYRDLEKKFDSNYCHMKAENRYTQYKCHFNSLLGITLNVGLIFYYILTMTNSGKTVKLGSITAIFQYLSQIMQAFWFYGTDYEQCIHWRADLEAVDEIFREAKDIQPVLEEAIDTHWNDIMIKSVNFKLENSKLALHNISLKLARGKKIAFVGESGSGKSTLLRIIRGIYPVNDCRVQIDGKNLDKNISVLSNITTLIPQEPEMFEHSILYNIAMGLECSEEEVNNAIYLSGFDEVIGKLPHGVYTKVSEDGVNMSGGEKQRLALARGIFSIKDSSIVLLDEPTSSLDSETESKVYERIFKHCSDKCIVSVLHRLHMLYLFDYIYVFKDGEIVGQGTLNELKNQNAYFNELWNNI